MILRHEFIVRWPDNTREEKGVDFVVYGKPAEQGHSAMALTVGCKLVIERLFYSRKRWTWKFKKMTWQNLFLLIFAVVRNA